MSHLQGWSSCTSDSSLLLGSFPCDLTTDCHCLCSHASLSMLCVCRIATKPGASALIGAISGSSRTGSRTHTPSSLASHIRRSPDNQLSRTADYSSGGRVSDNHSLSSTNTSATRYPPSSLSSTMERDSLHSISASRARDRYSAEQHAPWQENILTGKMPAV